MCEQSADHAPLQRSVFAVARCVISLAAARAAVKGPICRTDLRPLAKRGFRGRKQLGNRNVLCGFALRLPDPP